MINIHLNGDIIRCPDIQQIKEDLQKHRDKLLICQFGCTQYNCPAWNHYCFKNFPDNIHIRLTRKCSLWSKYEYKDEKRVYSCPKAQERWNNSKKQKNFRIDNTNYRKIASAGHYLMKISNYRSLFLSLTFPPWKPGFNPYKNENKLNESFSKFVENLRQNYNCAGYIAVRELGKHTRRYHYHILCSIPYIPFAALNSAWCSSISDFCDFSKNALSSDPENRLVEIGSPARAVRYICKYISKAKNQASKTRIMFISNNLLRLPVAVRNTEYNHYNKTGVMLVENYLLSFKSVTSAKISDYATAFRINNNQDFDSICSELIYPLFNLNDEKPVDLYSFPLVEPG